MDKKKQDNENFFYWRRIYRDAQTAYRDNLADMQRWWDQYQGKRDAETTGVDKDYADTDGAFPLVRNFTYELIESEVDSSVPQPKVTSPTKNKRKMRNARTVEAMIKSIIYKLGFEEINDIDERVVKVLGGSAINLSWDNRKGIDGELTAEFLSPLQIIPQPGIYRLDDMDYIFITHEETKNFLNSKYDADIDEWERDEDVYSFSGRLNNEGEDHDDNTEEVITQITCYYKNENGRLGVFSWAGNCILIDDDDYNARTNEVCSNCGRTRPFDADVCPDCGGEEWTARTKDYETLTEDYVLARDQDGNPTDIIPMMSTQKVTTPAKDGNIDMATVNGIDQTGAVMSMQPTKIPYYVPSDFPVVLRRNVSIYGQFLGDSDAGKIRDMQIQHNNLALKLQEKLFKGGSVLTLPKGLIIESSDREMKIVRVDKPEQINMIQALNLQPNVQQDMQMLEKYYNDARSTLGISDSYQGKRDTTAISGSAKQAMINQTQGRLESKSAMKFDSYRKIFRSIFQFMLAYSDVPIDFVSQGEDGTRETFTFDRHDFLVKNGAGEWYYDDDYLFDVDSAGGLTQNRQQMWQEIRQNFQSGAYGSPQDIGTLIMFWSQMEDADYPNAGAIKTQLTEQRDAQAQTQQAMQQAQAQAQQSQQQQSQQQPQRQQNTEQQPDTSKIDEALSRISQFIGK